MIDRVRLDHLVHAAASVIDGDIVPLVQLRTLDAGQERQRRRRASGLGGHGVRERSQVVAHAANRRPIEEVGVVVDREADLSVDLDDHQRQVELPFLLQRERQALERQIAERHPRAGDAGDERRRVLGLEPLRPLVDEQDLEERRSARLARGAQAIDEQRERIRLVIERAEQRVARLPQRLAEGRRLRQRKLQRQQVREVADHRLELWSRAPRRQVADHQIVLPGVALEQDRQQREQAHLRRGAAVAREALQLLGRAAIDSKFLRRAAEARHRWPRSIRRHVDDRHRGTELLFPVRKVARAFRARRHLGLPARPLVGGVLHRR